MNKREKIIIVKRAAEELESVAEKIENDTNRYTEAQAFVKTAAAHARHSIQYIEDIYD